MKTGKSNIRQIWMSVVALLIIMIMGAGVAYSWIEGGTTYTMVNTEPVSIGGVPTSEGTVTLNPDATNSKIQLIDYDMTTSQYLDLSFSSFSPVSSLDGKKFFVPSQYNSNGTISGYREANTNDIGTKFIKFDFDIKTAKKCYLAFNVAPTITAKKGSVSNIDTSPFRIMVSNGTNSYVFTTSNTVQSNDAITNVGGGKGTLTAQPTDFYWNNTETTKNRLFSYNANVTDTIQVAVWLDCNAPANKINALLGSDVTINMQLIVATPKCAVTYDARTYDNQGNKLANFAGGGIQVGTSSTKYTSGTERVIEDSSVTLKAVPNANYDFKGWYTDENFTTESQVTTSATLTKTVTSDITYFARFEEKPEYTINVVADPAAGGSVTAGSSGTSHKGYKGTTVKLSASANSGYGFVGWYDGATFVSSDANYDVTLSANKTYTAKFQQTRTTTIYIEPRSSYSNYYIYAYGANDHKTSDGSTRIIVDKSSFNHTNTYLYIYENDTPVIGDWPGTKLTKTDSGNYYLDIPSGTLSPDKTYYAIVNNNSGNQIPAGGESQGTKNNYTIHVGYEQTFMSNSIELDTTHFSGNWPGKKAEYDSATTYYKMTFNTADSGEFFAILNDGIDNGNRYPASGLPGLSDELGGTYLFTADNKLIEFNPADMFTFKVSALAGGSVKLNDSSSPLSLKVRPGQSIKISATPNSGYAFDGWYTNQAATTNIGSTYMTASQTITANGAGGSTVTYYAKFKQSTASLTVRTSVTPSGGGTATVNNATSVSNILSGSSVALNATPASGYKFVGWYTNSSCTTTIGNNYTSASTNYTVSGSNGTVTLYAKFEVSTTYTYYFVVRSDWNSNTIQYNNKYKSGTHTDTWKYANMTDTGYTYNGNKIWSATFNNDDVFYNVAFKIMNGSNQVAYQEAYAGSSGMGKSSLSGKMYVTDTGQWINFTHN